MNLSGRPQLLLDFHEAITCRGNVSSRLRMFVGRGCRLRMLAFVIISFRKIQARLHPDEDAQTQSLGLTPTSHQ